MPQGSLATRYANLALAFLVSACLHLSGNLARGIPVRDSGVFRFFLTQIAGIAFEDAAGALYRALSARYAGGGGGRQDPWWIRIPGYAWVAAFLAWTTPCWVYPIAATPPGRPMLPFSVVRPAREMLAGRG